MFFVLQIHYNKVKHTHFKSELRYLTKLVLAKTEFLHALLCKQCTSFVL